MGVARAQFALEYAAVFDHRLLGGYLKTKAYQRFILIGFIWIFLACGGGTLIDEQRESLFLGTHADADGTLPIGTHPGLVEAIRPEETGAGEG